jgi:hypothetical protein
VTAKLDYRWHLRDLMADRGMFSTTKLRPLLAERCWTSWDAGWKT